MKLTFLGTGTSQGIPMIGCRCQVCTSADERDKRLRTSALIETEGKKILIDAGPDFRQQMLRSGISHLDAILLTHLHKDHTGGLDDVRAFNFLEKRPFPIYCEERVLNSLKAEYAYVFDTSYPGIPQFDIHLIDEKPFEIEGVEIVPIRMLHYKLPVLGFRIGEIGYLTDGSSIADSEIEKLKGVKLLVINTVKLTSHISHFSLPEALEVIRKVGAEQSYLTHLSHMLPVHAELEKLLPGNVHAAYDLLEVEI